MKLKWSKYLGRCTAFQDPYYLMLHQSNGYWYYNCFLLGEDKKEVWLGGSVETDTIKSLTEAKKRVVKVMTEHRKEARRKASTR